MAYDRTEPAKPLPEFLARKNKGQMSEEDFRAVVNAAISGAVQYVDGEVSQERARATDYYLGKPFGNEEEGRSQVVLTEVRDAVDGMLPSLLRVFFGSEHAVEFAPTRADNVEQAAQKTDYVRYVFEEDNSGFLRTLDVLKDGLIRKIGIFMWGWDDSEETRAYKYAGLTRAELEMLAADDDITLNSVVPVPPKPPIQPEETYDVELTRVEKGGRARVWSVPPEELIYNREARSDEDAILLGRRMEKTRGELIELGVSESDIDEHGGTGDGDATLRGNPEEIARRDIASVGHTSGSGYEQDPDQGKANRKYLYCEVGMKVDFNGDGKAELRQICTIGPNYYPVKNVPTDERRFALFTPYPEPHTLLGGSVADRTMDVQKIDSSIMRAILDSGSASIFPRIAYKEGQASVADILNNAIGAPIRERETGAVRYLEAPFTGDKMLPVLTFMQEVVERRTGRNKGAAGLDADALQSTGKEAVGAVLTGSQEQLEMIARIFAEGTLKPLFRGLGRLLQERQPKKRVVRLRGNWVEVDPRTWTSGMDVQVNVALGSTFTEKKVSTLMAVAADQKEIMSATGGLASPVVTLPMLMNTRAKILSLQGIKDFDSYYTPLPPDWQPPAPPPPQPSPDELWIRAEKEMAHQKTMKDLAIKEEELKLNREKFEFEKAFKMRELEEKTEIERLKIAEKAKADERAADNAADSNAIAGAAAVGAGGSE